MNGIAKKLEVKSIIPLSRWTNDDIKPIESDRRTWTSWTFHNFWVLTNANVSTYFTGSALIALGLNWWQSIICIIVGNLIASVCVVLNSVPGGNYYIGFPVVNRYVWGMYGSQFVIWNRIFLSLIWYGFQAWVGGECFYICMMSLDPNLENHIPNHMPASTGMTTAQFVAYIIFSILSLPFVWIRPHKLEKFLIVASVTILVFFVVLLIWALATMGSAGFGDTISNSAAVEGTSTGWMMAYGIISTIGSIAAGILNQNDYSRFARRPRNAVYGQIFSFPLYGSLCSIFGILVTAATQNRFGEPLWNLPDIFTTLIAGGGSGTRAVCFFAGLALVVSQIGVNVPGNALSGGCDLAATFPRYLNIRRGAYLTAILSTVTNPWRLVNTATTFLSVLSSYAVFLGPMVGMMIASYYIVNKQKIKVTDLFVGNATSIYWYTWGINWRAIVAWICGVGPSLPGFIAAVDLSVTVPTGLTNLYYICFIAGFSISGAVYALLHYIFPAQSCQAFVQNPSTPKELMHEYTDMWDEEDRSNVLHGQICDDSDTFVEQGLPDVYGKMDDGSIH